jgi:hypothetical protein
VATNPEERPEERQRRELEEIRRKFTEVGARLVPAFEPPTPADREQPPHALPPAPPLDQPARPGWQWLVAAALVFVLGTGLGYLLPRPGAGAQPVPPSTQPPATTLVAPRTTTPPPPPPSAVVPPACLETARRGDETINLLVRNVRNRRLAEVLKAYTLASQACRKEASP